MLTSGNTTIASSTGGSFNAYMSVPSNPNGRGVLILHEIFGVNSAMRALADRFARDGYHAMVPELFWRTAPGVELNYSRAETLRAMEMVSEYQSEDGIVDTWDAVQHLSAIANVADVALVGLCLGGLLAYRTASRHPVAAAISFYSTDINKHMDEMVSIGCPLAFHYGAKDRFIPASLVDEVDAAVKQRGAGEVFVYPEGEHGFYTRGSEQDMQLAHARVLTLIGHQPQ